MILQQDFLYRDVHIKTPRNGKSCFLFPKPIDLISYIWYPSDIRQICCFKEESLLINSRQIIL